MKIFHYKTSEISFVPLECENSTLSRALWIRNFQESSMLIFSQAEEPDGLDLLLYKNFNSLLLIALRFSMAKLVPRTSTEMKNCLSVR